MEHASSGPPDRAAWARMASPDSGTWPVGRLLSTVSRRIEREWNAHLASWDLNHASLPVLIHLLAQPRTQREIAALNNVTEQTMSRILARLERSGYVVRTPHETDRRKFVVAVTDAGRAVAMLAVDRRPAEAMTTRGLTTEQVEQLRELLTIMLRASMDAEGLPAGRTSTTDAADAS